MTPAKTTAILVDNPFLLLADHVANSGQGLPAGMGPWRLKQWERFAAQGLPTIKNEEWRYTDLTALASAPYTLAASGPCPSWGQAETGKLSRDDVNLVFINGFFQPALIPEDRIPEGVQVRLFSELGFAPPREFQDVFERLKDHPFETFSGLNEALAAEGLWVHIKKNAAVAPLIHICHLTEGREQPLLVTPRILVTAEPGATAAFFVSYRSLKNTGRPVLINALTDVSIKPEARIFLCSSQDSNGDDFLVDSTRAVLEKDAVFENFSSVTGGRLTRNNLNVHLTGEGATAALCGLSLVRDKQLADQHVYVHHAAPRCVSNQLYKSVLGGQSRSVFNGKIFVHPQAQQTNAYQLNKNLLMSRECRADTKPQLEIFADDVKCSHGAAVGQMDDEQILYLQTRGIGRDDAVRMLVHGFVEDVLDRIPLPLMRKKISGSIGPALLDVTR